MKIVLLISLILLVTKFSLAQTSEWKQVWKIDNLPNPESVVYDSTRDVLYVSNQDSNGQKGTASIGMLSLEGDVIKKSWIQGLNEPKGIAILKNKLYVSDLTELVEIDIEQGKIIHRYQGEDAQFLNDVAIDKSGNVYVSDMFTSAIYKLDTNGSFRLWIKDPLLQNPNGLLVSGDDLLVSAWGSFSDGNPMTSAKGSVLKVSLLNKKIHLLSDSPIGNLDGLQVFQQNNYLLSDWVTGDIFVYKNGSATRVLDLEQSAGDIAYLKHKGLLLVPMAIQGQVLAFKQIEE